MPVPTRPETKEKTMTNPTETAALSRKYRLFEDESHTEVQRLWVADFNATVKAAGSSARCPVGSPCALLIALDFPKGATLTVGDIQEGIASTQFPMEWNLGDARVWVAQFTPLAFDDYATCRPVEFLTEPLTEDDLERIDMALCEAQQIARRGCVEQTVPNKNREGALGKIRKKVLGQIAALQNAKQ